MSEHYGNRLIKGSFIYGIGNILNKFLLFLLLPIYTSYLHPEDFGIIAILQLLTMFLTGIFTLGTGSSIGICYSETNIPRIRAQIVWSNFVLLLIVSLFLFLLSVLFRYNLSTLLFMKDSYSYYIVLTVAGLLFISMNTPLNSFLRLEEKAKSVITISLISTTITIGLSILFIVVLKRGIKGLIEATFLGQILTFVMTFFEVLKLIKVSVDFNHIPKLIKIGFPSIFGIGAFFLIDWSDRFFVEHFVGLHELGIYIIGYNIGLIMAIFAESAFGSAWPPFFMKYINKKDEAKIVFGRIFKYFVLGYSVLSLLFFAGAKPLIYLMTNQSFYDAWTIIGIIGISYVLKTAYLILLPGIVFEKKIYIQTIIEWIAALANLALNIILIPVLKKEGAAIATLISYILLVSITYFVNKRFLPLRIEWKAVNICLLVFITLVVLIYVNPLSILFYYSVLNLFICLLFVFTVYRFILSIDERVKIWALVAEYKKMIVK